MSTSVPVFPPSYQPTQPLFDQRFAAFRPPPLPPTTPATAAGALGRYGDLLGILLRGFALTFATLGVYRFWMKTQVRQWYWRNTRIGYDTFEYTGTGRELFIGFLFAVAILLPIYGVIVGATYFSGLLSFTTASKVFLVFVIVFAQYAHYRARRYRLTRTVWRGLTFSQTGSAWHYTGLAIAGTVVSLVSLGLAHPFVRAMLAGYMARNTRFGSAEGSFGGVAFVPLLVWWAILWLPILAGVGYALVWLWQNAGGSAMLEALALLTGFSDREPDSLPADIMTATGVLGAAIGLATLWGLAFWPVYRVVEFRAFTDATRIGPVGFRSSARAAWYYGAIVRLVLMNGLISAAIATIVGMVGYLAWQALGNQLLKGELAVYAGQAAFAIVYLVFIVAFVILREIIVQQGFWRHVLSTLEVYGLEGVDQIVARGQTDRAVGEGLADALDAGGAF